MICIMTIKIIEKESFMKNSKEAETHQTSINVRKTKSIAYTILLISGLYVLSTTGWILTENRNIMTVMEILTIWAAVVILQFMIELYRGSSENRKSQSMIALILTACMATVTIINHFIYLTVLNQIFHEKAMPSWLLLDGWPSVTKGFECVSWGFFLGMAMIFASSALTDFGNKAAAWTMRISGILTLAGLIGPISGNMNFYILSTIGYSVGFLVISIEMLVHLRIKVEKE